ncbi:unnamed protein product [Cylicocyclus nassatus]|uniref:Reverse transcriptase domain-containing protein n=1 Tax=Cylicocyclus nassatus TaxID=53992 RepID=A0AA36GSU5_CYLNA|nr:unnamed protein product [Cylicocyclus nassatus]
MPMGLKGAPATFQRIMDDFKKYIRARSIFIYIDDLIITSETPEEHLADIDEVLGKIEIIGMKLKASKCEFAKEEIKFLGFILSKEGIRSNPDKTKAIDNYPQPTNPTDAINNEFLGDPSALSHDCLPAKIAQDKVERLLYKECENIRKDKRRVGTTTRKAWQEIENHIEENEGENETQKLDMLHYFHRDGYESRRSTIKRAIKSLDNKSCTMDHVPRIYSHFSDGERFLQFQTPDLHMYYSTATIEKAQRFGLYALVADGVHDLQPDATAKCGQLYTVHGVCNDTMDAPLLYAITTTKNERTYELIFAQLKEELQRSGRLDRLRVVLDFERASIGAARKVFPFASVEALHRRVPSLYRPDLPRNNEAYQICEEFLRYLKSTWYEGPFKGMWNKWGIKDTRTTNAAEAFHRNLGTLLECKYPLMSRLLEELKSCNNNAKGDFLNMERRPTDGRRLRRRDLRRREKILKMMAAYRSRFERRNTIRTSTNQIMKYCRKMATFVTSKIN